MASVSLALVLCTQCRRKLPVCHGLNHYRLLCDSLIKPEEKLLLMFICRMQFESIAPITTTTTTERRQRIISRSDAIIDYKHATALTDVLPNSRVGLMFVWCLSVALIRCLYSSITCITTWDAVHIYFTGFVR